MNDIDTDTDNLVLIRLTHDEAVNLIKLLNIAVQAGGLPNAKVALPIAEKTEEALNE